MPTLKGWPESQHTRPECPISDNQPLVKTGFKSTVYEHLGALAPRGVEACAGLPWFNARSIPTRVHDEISAFRRISQGQERPARKTVDCQWKRSPPPH
jgi:hypothetical protein